MSLGMTMGTFSIERVGIIPFLFWVLVFLLANGTFYGPCPYLDHFSSQASLLISD